MSKISLRSLRPKRGFSHILHIALVALLPVLLLVLVRLEFVAAAFTVFLLSKWRIIAVRPRYWFTNITLGIVDVMFGLSVLFALISATSFPLQVAWTTAYVVWMVYIKPQSTKIFMGVQAILATSLFVGTILARYAHYDAIVLVILFWAAYYFGAKHFLSAFDEEGIKVLASIWGLFAAQVGFIASHWLVFFGPIAQPVVLLSVLSVGAMSLYYLDHEDKLSGFAKKQIIVTTIILTILVVIFTDWGNKVV